MPTKPVVPVMSTPPGRARRVTALRAAMVPLAVVSYGRGSGRGATPDSRLPTRRSGKRPIGESLGPAWLIFRPRPCGPPSALDDARTRDVDSPPHGAPAQALGLGLRGRAAHPRAAARRRGRDRASAGVRLDRSPAPRGAGGGDPAAAPPGAPRPAGRHLLQPAPRARLARV